MGRTYARSNDYALESRLQLTRREEELRKFVDFNLNLKESFDETVGNAALKKVIYFGVEIYVPATVKYIAISKTGSVQGFDRKPKYPKDQGDWRLKSGTRVVELGVIDGLDSDACPKELIINSRVKV